ncbi:hypothetical protein TrST_g3901 [Triparma strigata]|uniref:HMG box domain-containing protein n=1 Tax=Triparma strigata TaxID=1606541 RepID=A0A9W7BNJ6_9STRA|nr:hypothetical protein TrST_g3901 [Triparma strigata]
MVYTSPSTATNVSASSAAEGSKTSKFNSPKLSTLFTPASKLNNATPATKNEETNDDRNDGASTENTDPNDSIKSVKPNVVEYTVTTTSTSGQTSTLSFDSYMSARKYYLSESSLKPPSCILNSGPKTLDTYPPPSKSPLKRKSVPKVYPPPPPYAPLTLTGLPLKPPRSSYAIFSISQRSLFRDVMISKKDFKEEHVDVVMKEVWEEMEEEDKEEWRGKERDERRVYDEEFAKYPENIYQSNLLLHPTTTKFIYRSSLGLPLPPLPQSSLTYFKDCNRGTIKEAMEGIEGFKNVHVEVKLVELFEGCKEEWEGLWKEEKERVEILRRENKRNIEEKEKFDAFFGRTKKEKKVKVEKSLPDGWKMEEKERQLKVPGALPTNYKKDREGLLIWLKERCGKKGSKVDLYFACLIWRAELETGEVRSLLHDKGSGHILMYYGTSRSQGFTVMSEREMEERCVEWSEGCSKGFEKQLGEKLAGLSKDEAILKKGVAEALADLKVEEKSERGKSMLPPRPQRENSKIVDKQFTHRSGVVVRSWRDVDRVEEILQQEGGKGVGKKSIEFRLKKIKDEDKKKEKEAKKEDSNSNVGEVGGEGKGEVVVEEVENMELGGGEGVAQ